MGILPRADQENVGRIPAECPASRVTLERYGIEGGHQKPIT